MKYKTTKKAMKEAYGRNLVSVPNGTMQIFKNISPNSYSTRVEGWACDYYEVDGLCICEGYSPVGKQILDYDECKPFRDSAERIRMFSPYDKELDELAALFKDFVATIKEKLERKRK